MGELSDAPRRERGLPKAQANFFTARHADAAKRALDHPFVKFFKQARPRGPETATAGVLA